MKGIRNCFSMCLIALSGNIFAVEIADMDVPSTVKLVGVEPTLQLNGAGVRSKFII